MHGIKGELYQLEFQIAAGGSKGNIAIETNLLFQGQPVKCDDDLFMRVFAQPVLDNFINVPLTEAHLAQFAAAIDQRMWMWKTEWWDFEIFDMSYNFRTPPKALIEWVNHALAPLSVEDHRYV